jgi:hypothetical protein
MLRLDSRGAGWLDLPEISRTIGSKLFKSIN